jgi:hypothetical protein
VPYLVLAAIVMYGARRRRLSASGLKSQRRLSDSTGAFSRVMPALSDPAVPVQQHLFLHPSLRAFGVSLLQHLQQNLPR